MAGILRYQSITIESPTSSPVNFRVGASTGHLVPHQSIPYWRAFIKSLNEISGYSQTFHTVLFLVSLIQIFFLVFVISINSPKHVVFSATISVVGLFFWSGVVIRCSYLRQLQQIRAKFKKNFRIIEPWFLLTKIRIYFSESKQVGVRLFTYPSYRINLKIKNFNSQIDAWTEFIFDLQESPGEREKINYDEFGLPELQQFEPNIGPFDRHQTGGEDFEKSSLYFRKLKKRSEKRNFWEKFRNVFKGPQANQKTLRLRKSIEENQGFPELKKRNFLDSQLMTLSQIWSVADQFNTQNLSWLDKFIRKLKTRVRNSRIKRAKGWFLTEQELNRGRKRVNYIKPTGTRKKSRENNILH